MEIANYITNSAKGDCWNRPWYAIMGKISMIRRIHSCQHSFLPLPAPSGGLTRAALCTVCACLLAAGEHSHRPGEPDPGRLCHSPRRVPCCPRRWLLSLPAPTCCWALPVCRCSPALPAGPGVLFGMTGGYLLAYPIMAWLLSMVCEKTRSRGARMAGGGTGKPVLLPAGHRLVHGCHRAWDCGRPSRPV